MATMMTAHLRIHSAGRRVALAARFPGWSLTVCSPQIARLEQTWMTLRQRHTEGAILYEKKLKPFLKSLNEGKGTAPCCCVTLPSRGALRALSLHSLCTWQLCQPCPGVALGARPRVQSI